MFRPRGSSSAVIGVCSLVTVQLLQLKKTHVVKTFCASIVLVWATIKVDKDYFEMSHNVIITVTSNSTLLQSSPNIILRKINHIFVGSFDMREIHK